VKIILHKDNIALELLNSNLETLSTNDFASQNLSAFVFEVAQAFPKELIIWCHKDLKSSLNLPEYSEVFHHKAILATFNPTKIEYLLDGIGYVERFFYLKINKKQLFPTWVMSDIVGGAYGEMLLSFKHVTSHKNTFNYNLNSIAKLGNTQGLFCYSNPKLLKLKVNFNDCVTCSKTELFHFVKQHYKWVWVWYLLFCFIIFEKKFYLITFIKSLFISQNPIEYDLSHIKISSNNKVVSHKEIDVIIPTMGRKTYLYDVLKDFSKQSILPKRIIIVEQNPDKHSSTDLDYIDNEVWPFEIIHKFTHRTGVVNARNQALSEVKSEWTFLGDDDNRFKSDLIERLFNRIESYGVNVGTTVYIQPNEKQTYLKTSQTSIFGAGNSILKTKLLKKVSFRDEFEFNYGEDIDFGMQLRLNGEDVVYFADVKITHLKAPVGGYRTKVKQLWSEETIQPVPSPTIMLMYKTYHTEKQLKGYKLLLFIRRFKAAKTLKFFSFVNTFKLEWNKSEDWSNKLN
jgi:GT2 family glycosyltransferase